MGLKIVLRVFAISLLAYYVFYVNTIGWGFMLHAFNPLLFENGDLSFTPVGLVQTAIFSVLIFFYLYGLITVAILFAFSLIEKRILNNWFVFEFNFYSFALIYIGFTKGIPIIFVIIFALLPLTVAVFLLKSFFKKKDIGLEAKESKDDQITKKNKETKNKILILNIFIPYVVFTATSIVELLFYYIKLPSREVSFNMLLWSFLFYLLPFYSVSGFINTEILLLLSRFNKKVVNERFIIIFVSCFSFLIFVIKPLWFVSTIFFLVSLSFIVMVMNIHKIALRIRR